MPCAYIVASLIVPRPRDAGSESKRIARTRNSQRSKTFLTVGTSFLRRRHLSSRHYTRRRFSA
eukprot:1866969-Pleurochrysis_carterae.AAC.1